MHTNKCVLTMLFQWIWKVYCTSADNSTTSSVSNFIPHCSKNFIVSGQISRQNIDPSTPFQHELSFSTDFRLDLGFRETICLKVKLYSPEWTNQTDDKNETYDPMVKEFLKHNDSLVYTITFKNLLQIHPVRQEYTFGIPYLRSNCVCDCPHGDKICPIGFKYKNCSTEAKNSLCLTTYHAHQSARGCTLGGEAELCCQIRMSPMKDRRFKAVYLGQPETVAQLSYGLYRVPENGREWSLVGDGLLKIPLNKEHKMNLNDGMFTIMINALKPSYQLKEGMFFYNEEDTSSLQQNSKSADLRKPLRRISLKTGPPLNELYEWNVEKLGWFRWEGRRWTFRNGWIKIQDAQHVEVQNCKNQQYSENYNAEYLTMDDSKEDAVYLGHPVESEERWISKVYVESKESSRQILIIHADSPAITVQFHSRTKIDLTFYHHSSKLADFSGQIEIDKYSNRFLNITYRGAQGTLLGYIYRTSDKLIPDMAFSSYLGYENSTEVNSLLSLPLFINTSRYVCVHPVDRSREEKCRWFEIQYHPLDLYEVPYTWSANQGECPGCNEVGINDFLSYLNPMKWLRGISSTAEAVAVAVEVTFYLAVILVVITVIRKCFIPLLNISFCKPVLCSARKK